MARRILDQLERLSENLGAMQGVQATFDARLAAEEQRRQDEAARAATSQNNVQQVGVAASMPLPPPVPRFKPNKPKELSTISNFKLLEDWLYDVENYFRLTGCNTDELQVACAQTFLTGEAKQWWRSMESERGRPQSWDELT